MAQKNRRVLGFLAERQAADYLEAQGCRIVERNYYFRGGEIDLIVADGAYLCFVEVKYRKDMALGDPTEAVDQRKQRKLLSGARYYLYERRLPEQTLCRFDVVSVLGQEIVWLKDAFQG